MRELPMLQRMANSLMENEIAKASPDPSAFLFSSGLHLSAGKPLKAGHALYEYAEQLTRRSGRDVPPLTRPVLGKEAIQRVGEMEEALELHRNKMKAVVDAIENSVPMQDLLSMLKSEERDKFRSGNRRAHVVPVLFALGKYRRWLARNPEATYAQRKVKLEQVFHTANAGYSAFTGHGPNYHRLDPNFFDALRETSLPNVLRNEGMYQTLVVRSLKERAASLSEEVLGGRNVPLAWKEIERAVAPHLPEGYEADLMHELFQKVWAGLLVGKYLKDYLHALREGNRKTE